MRPQILLLDLETAPNIVTSHSLWERGGLNVPYQGILQERHIICASWKWYRKPQIYSTSIAATPLHPFNPNRDKAVVRNLHFVLSQADAVVAHNGDEFDIPWVRARVAYYGLTPIPPIVQIDTRKIARSKFKFNSNRLDYLGKFLGIGQKIKTDYDLWLDCLMGDEKALNKMVEYNRRDVYPLLEKVFERLLPYVPAKINFALFGSGVECPTCGDTRVHKRGWQMAKSKMYQRYQCQSCGAWCHSKTAEKDKKVKYV